MEELYNICLFQLVPDKPREFSMVVIFIPGSKVQVVGYDPRPFIKITPAQSAKDRRVQTYYYVEAVRTLQVTLPDSDLIPIIRRINPKLQGQIRSLFVILSDDLYQPWAPPAKSPSVAQSNSSAKSKEAGTEEISPVPVNPSGRKSFKRGAPSIQGGPSKK